MTRAIKCSEVDIRRAIKGVQATGLTVHAVEIAPDGCIRVITSPTEVATSPVSALEQWEIENGYRSPPMSRKRPPTGG